ncbi:ATP-binding protein [Sphaerotilus sp.]|uniref:hybrid sensor histidine kinase/response regulator n=1 Tax=Sphaerotilus sp. TaxID=2093942 RepID=UPI002ACD7E5F|nr:ATP-binding protein [Sphaerotilus sp.]MDZ7857715.1 ATP-binding protein [Sphaerotilus sp.]
MTTAAGNSAILPVQADSGPAPANPQAAEPVQRVIKIRRDYNTWVASETLEDYALRFTPRSARRWSIGRVANTALGGAASFLVLEAVGATLLVRYGFTNAALAILATGLVIFLAGLPISAYAARHGLDMDLLTRGAGFGYIGSTITSLIYASFTFIFFALEAAVMAYALELAFDIPLAWGYGVCAAVVLPLVTHGVTVISRLQVWTQPLWALMLVTPYVFVFRENPGVLDGLLGYGGERGLTAFDPLAFGAAMTVGIALITQMGEQADYLRFMPERTRDNRVRWWAGVVAGGPGWVVPGVLKMLGGALLAFLTIGHSVPVERAVDPNQMYLTAYEHVFSHYGWAVAATAVFVIISQVKINVTNAYAGSLAWSNFFSRLTHSHPGRVVWVVFNTGIALMLMELDVFQALGHVLGLYANIAISWMMAVVADLVINKPLGLSPKGIEFRRAHLCDINPVGVGAMGIASAVSVAAHLGLFGEMAQAWSALIALVTALVASPLLAWWTGGRWYLAQRVGVPADEAGRYRRYAPPQSCTICERAYEAEDMAHCPAYGGAICSLCCTLDARCHDLCKVPEAGLAAQWSAVLRWLLPRAVWPYLDKGLAHYLLLMLVTLPLLGGLAVARRALVLPTLALVAGVVAWWLVLAHKSRQVAQEEANRQTQALHEQTLALRREIASHQETDRALQQAKRQADAANQAKSRYITTISHELRTPLNSILGYAQLLEDDETMPPARQQAVSVIRRGGDHLLTLIEGTLDIARIESGKLRLEVRPMRFAEAMDEIGRLFALQAAAKGIAFRCEFTGLPVCVRADEKRLRQILINIVGNAIKFTRAGEVVLRLHHAREMARIEVIDSGPGMSPEELARIFEPFERGSASGGAVTGGAGLGLTISKMLTDLMGGELTVESTPGVGTTFRLRLFLPEVRDDHLVGPVAPPRRRIGYAGPRRCVLVVDNEEVDRGLIVSLLAPLGFTIRQAASGEACLALLEAWQHGDANGDDAGSMPDAVFMDLAMPGIDGWETLRRLRAQGLGAVPAAIVSANAFDKGLDNDVGITPADFLVKPVRVGELLDWLGRRLALEWVETIPPVAPGVAPPAVVLPDAPRLRALQEAASLGHVRGVLRLLDALDTERPECRDFSDRLRTLARQFQLDAMSGLLRKALDDAHA